MALTEKDPGRLASVSPRQFVDLPNMPPSLVEAPGAQEWNQALQKFWGNFRRALGDQFLDNHKRSSSIVSEFDGDVATLTARIATEESVRASADGALAVRTTTLESQVQTPTTGLLARVTTIEGTYATEAFAEAKKTEAISVASGFSMRFTPIRTSGVDDLGGGTFRTNDSFASGWNNAVRSTEGFSGAVELQFNVKDGAVMGGITRTPDSPPGDDYNSIQFAWYPTTSMTAEIYESGVYIGTFGGWTVDTVFSITYDGANVRYFKDGELQRTVALATTDKWYFDGALYQGAGRGLERVRFGPQAGGSSNAYAVVAIESAARISADGQIHARWGVAIDVNGRVIGRINLNGTNQSSEFKVAVDKFVVENANGTVTAMDIRPGGKIVFGADIQSDNYDGSNGWRLTRAGDLEANSGTFRGTVRIGAATAFNSGTGVWMGMDGGVAKFRVGDPAGARIEWNGTSWSVVSFPTSSALVAFVDALEALKSGGNTGLTTNDDYGVTPSGGSGTYTYSWSRVSGSTAITAQSSTSRFTKFVSSGGTNEVLEAYFKCVVSDGATSVDSDQIRVEFIHGTPP